VKKPDPTPCQGSAMHLQPSGPVQRLTEAQFWPHVGPLLCCCVPGGFEPEVPPVAWLLAPAWIIGAGGLTAVGSPKGTPSASAKTSLPAATSAVT